MRPNRTPIPVPPGGGRGLGWARAGGTPTLPRRAHHINHITAGLRRRGARIISPEAGMDFLCSDFKQVGRAKKPILREQTTANPTLSSGSTPIRRDSARKRATSRPGAFVQGAATTNARGRGTCNGCTTGEKRDTLAARCASQLRRSVAENPLPPSARNNSG